MNMTVHQTITINSLRVEAITHSSVLQVGTAGLIKAISYRYNTGGFTKPIPPEVQLPPLGPLVPLAY